jgi:hypothetical protein
LKLKKGKDVFLFVSIYACFLIISNARTAPIMMMTTMIAAPMVQRSVGVAKFDSVVAVGADVAGKLA